MAIHNILPLLSGVKKTGVDRYKALCPVHSEKTPSLLLTDKDGKILIHCFGCGCGIDEIAKALGISLDAFFPDNPSVDYSVSYKRAYFNSTDLLSTLVHESTIVALCASDILAGKTLTSENKIRLGIAINKIDEVAYYARSRY
jgi:hypothetical protein